MLPSMDDVAEAKAALRRTALEARQSLDDGQRRAASDQIVGRVLAIPELLRARTVVTYAARADEADLAGALAHLHDRSIRTLFPRVRDDDLELVAATDLLTLTLGYRGIREPVGPNVDAGVVDVALLPGVAFDVVGGRLGHGGGHYDRLLGRLPPHALRVGIAFSCQVVPRVPREDHDEPVDIVVTEKATYHTHARATDVPG